jgi:DNA replication and repair protein RecF
MLERLSLQDFRGYSQVEFEFAPLTVFVGSNGAGKTNILEAISLLSMTTSWRTEKDSEVIRWEQPFCRVVGGRHELVIQRSPYLKRLRIDGIAKRTYQVIGDMPTVLFQPDDIQIIYGSPAGRRQYLDRTVSQTSTIYTRAILELAKVLKQRNRLLKMISENNAGTDELVFWDSELEKLHETITGPRQEFLKFLNMRLPSIFAQMVPQGGGMAAEYLQSPRHPHPGFLAHLKAQRHKELVNGSTLYGPHREDVGLRWGEHLVSESMSRGQSRALLLAMKIVELEYISEKNEIRPILLLDDIFSELDQERRERLVAVLGDYQAILTTTELGTVRELLPKQAKVVEI